MRSDMSKVLVERPRLGGCGKQKIRNNRRKARIVCKMATFDTDVETTDFHGMKRVHTCSPNSFDDTKELNENLRPLRRFLRSKIGQNWNKVYSEIMQGLNLNNAVQFHVWQHLIELGEVETKTYMEGNTVMAAGVIGPKAMTNKNYVWYEEFYVDPRDGTLRCTEVNHKKNRNNREREKATLDDFRYIDYKKPLVQFHMIDGVWYEYQMREASEDEKKNQCFGEYVRDFDAEKVKWVYRWSRTYEDKFVLQLTQYRNFDMPYWNYRKNLWEVCEKLFGGAYLPVSKRQVGSKEVKKIEALMSQRKPHKKAA